MREPQRKQKSKGGDVLLAALTCLNLLLTIALHLLRRQEIVHAVQQGDGVTVLLTEKTKKIPPDFEKKENEKTA